VEEERKAVEAAWLWWKSETSHQAEKSRQAGLHIGQAHIWQGATYWEGICSVGRQDYNQAGYMQHIGQAHIWQGTVPRISRVCDMFRIHMLRIMEQAASNI